MQPNFAFSCTFLDAERLSVGMKMTVFNRIRACINGGVFHEFPTFGGSPEISDLRVWGSKSEGVGKPPKTMYTHICDVSK